MAAHAHPHWGGSLGEQGEECGGLPGKVLVHFVCLSFFVLYSCIALFCIAGKQKLTQYTVNHLT